MSTIILLLIGAAGGVVLTTFVGAISVWVRAQKDKHF